MSFNALDVDLESQKPYSDSPEFDRAAEEASNVLLEVNNHLVTLHKQLESLHTKRNLANSEKVSAKCVSSMDQLGSLFKSLGQLVKELNIDGDLNSAQQFTRDKITREAKHCMQEFADSQDEFTSLSKSINAEAQAALDEQVQSDGSPLLPGKASSQMVLEQDVINNEEFVYQQNLIREREEEIQNIEHGIQELNEIFNDLGTIVQEQGTMVDNIESNIYDISNSTKDAAGQLTKALRYQRRSGRRTMCLLLIICVILAVVLLGIFI
ncbi:SNAP receptor PEP12 [Cyberlindnera jadinii NRRL Y-1542]|uniref:Syntaxin PEP12 n=1 Tax=Cyberlindnera jadinii (strain ATCC 18201 / CBS 1600 / BCRC 20928 / JCM 3617 / NBRC 0987 / NRRL Y-1542) TaxID=983966 RepID=A0A1E4S0T4_CYBJN|nr:syntaxin PEP12 [Cyberlindnera jadinii NRRL Y-1542]ODV73105.1 syntaxin PEP12 [Cyberlindnera jadinii NRRL Y-1542]